MRFLVHFLMAAASLVWAGGNDARVNFEAGERALRTGDSLRAFVYFKRAMELEPANRLYAQRKQALENSNALKREPVRAPDPALETLETKMIESGQIEESAAALEPPQLNPKQGRKSFHLRGDAVTLWTMVADGFGVQVLFDRTYQPLPTLRLDLEEVELGEAFRAMQAASDSFATPVTDHTIMVARDAADRRAELTAVVAMAVPIPERLTVQEAQEISTAVQQTMEIRRITLDPLKRVVYIRDSYTKALAARQLFEQLARPRAQVEVEIEFLEIAKTSTLNYGFLPPTGAPVIDFGVLPSNITIPTLPQNVGFATLGGGASRIGLGITDSTLFGTVSSAESQTLLRTSMVALDGQASSMHIGDRFPVITSSFSTVGGGQASNPGLSAGIQYIDLGLSLKLTPAVHEDSEVSLDLDAAFKTLGAASVNNIPEISNREYQGKVRLKAGEWAVIAGLITASDFPTITGVAGLADVPVLGNLFRHKTTEVARTETLVVIKPRIVNLPAWETVTKPLWTGSETRPITAF